ncbi:hypothetical protein K435DRAFT_927179 [Dendrothele bispora CBS 962.96]|uniref:Ricin B lectin domain-containing protein n=1 Tax=Dendrothele bispora (strain CBS 962.96) TaxID=1314807 RepID=A0A4S8L888_DENBC|nr:hypothetical protein K435DRAFT_927179 [Dendrothele bispora CBS 962.96]
MVVNESCEPVDPSSDDAPIVALPGKERKKKDKVKRFSLPPGIYNVHSSEKHPRAVVSPANDGEQLYVARISDSALNQQFLINAIGVFTAMDTGAHAFSVIPSFVNATVTRSDTEVSKIEWIINVERKKKKGKFKGYIMSSDNKKNFWALNGNSDQPWVIANLPGFGEKVV